jgi:hypothetical protein
MRAYFVAGTPKQGSGTFGSFEKWYQIVRGALVWLGLPDPMGNRKEMEENDTAKSLLKLIHAGIAEADPDGAGLTTKQMQDAIEKREKDGGSSYPSLVAASIDVCGAKFDPKRFGKALSKFCDRTLGGQKLGGQKVSGVTRWKLLSVEKPAKENGFDGFDGLVSETPTRGNLCVLHTHTDTTHTNTHRVLGETNPCNPSNPLGNDLDDGVGF